MTDERNTATSSPSADPPSPTSVGLSRRALLTGAVGVAATAVFADATGLTHGISQGLTGSTATPAGTAAHASETPVEPRHGAGEWQDEPPQDDLDQSPTTVITGDIDAMPLDWSL